MTMVIYICSAGLLGVITIGVQNIFRHEKNEMPRIEPTNIDELPE
jgi:hypothetical protein